MRTFGFAWKSTPVRPFRPSRGDYISLAVNQAARVAACGHGGQVVVSEAAAESATRP